MGVAEGFDLKAACSLSPPFFVRKLPKAGSWGSLGEEPQAVRAERIAREVFAPDEENAVSLWCVETALDFERISLALNANRMDGPIQDLYLVAIAPRELGDIKVPHTGGETDCWWANRLHFNALIKNPEQSLTLAWQLVATKRQRIKLNKTQMKHIVDKSKKADCKAVNKDSVGCDCEVTSRLDVM